MKNSPEALKNRNLKRAAWKRKIDPATVPPTKKRKCKDCGKTKPCGWNYTFSCTGKPEYRTHCTDCIKIYHAKIRKKNQKHIATHHKEHINNRKRWAVGYLGGKCKICGYAKSNAVLTFHHRIREKKDMEVGQMLDWSLTRLKTELDKCDLLCFNCHMELEEQIRKNKKCISTNQTV